MLESDAAVWKRSSSYRGLGVVNMSGRLKKLYLRAVVMLVPDGKGLPEPRMKTYEPSFGDILLRELTWVKCSYRATDLGMDTGTRIYRTLYFDQALLYRSVTTVNKSLCGFTRFPLIPDASSPNGLMRDFCLCVTRIFVNIARDDPFSLSRVKYHGSGSKLAVKRSG